MNLIWVWVLGCGSLGLLIGFLAGLFGIGGGILLIPLLVTILPFMGIPTALVLKVSIGTSMAIIVLTLLASALFHWRLGWREWAYDLALMPGVMVGALIGPIFAHDVSAQTLSRVMAVLFLFFAGWLLFAAGPPHRQKASQAKEDFSAPKRLSWKERFSLGGLGGVVGLLATLGGIGGGLFLTPVLTQVFRLSIQKAIGTATMSAVKIAMLGAVGYAIHPVSHEKALPYVVGSIYWPVVLPFALSSLISARQGALLAHRLSQTMLQRIFGLFLCFVAYRFFQL